MADGIDITAGTGTTVLTDDTGATGHAQVVKLGISTDGSPTLIPSDGTDGLLVNLGTNNDVTVTGNVAVDLNAGTNNIGDVDIASIAAGDNNIGNVDVVTLPGVDLNAGTNNIGDVDVASIAAGDNNIGNVDIVTVPAPLSTTGGGTEATAHRVTIASDSTGVLSVDDNNSSLTVDGTVGLTSGTGRPSPEAHGQTLITKTAQYTTQQTGAALWTPAAGNKVVVFYLQVQTTGTTGGEVQVWFGASGDSAYTRGTDAALFDGSFIPSATSYPGVVIQPAVPFVGTDDYILRVTTSAAIDALTVTAWGYEIA